MLFLLNGFTVVAKILNLKPHARKIFPTFAINPYTSLIFHDEDVTSTNS
ncbi:MAG: hypothetical protein HRU34_19045 [Richelia sp.]|nr:hypothetical protein [Richelia sp.]